MLYRASCEPVDFKLPKVQGAPKLDGDHADTVLQLRASRQGKPYHVIIPPSVHPNGEELEWVIMTRGQPDVLPTVVDGDDLRERAGVLAAACFFLRFYPSQGSRDDFALALTGALLRGRWDAEAVQEFVGRIAAMAGDEETDKRASKAVRSQARLDAGRAVYGLPQVARLCGVPIEWAHEVGKWLGIRKDGNAVFIGEIPETSRQAWLRLADYYIGADPAVYVYGDTLARVEGSAVTVLDKDKLQHELNRCATWFKQAGHKDDGTPKWVRTNCPASVVADMFAARRDQIDLPPLVGVTSVPIFTRDGQLHDTPGYDFGSGFFYRPSVAIERESLEFLLALIQDFPFVDQSDRAHAVAMILERFARGLFEGPSPLYLLNKPSPGTGASLLVECATEIVMGRPAGAQVQPKREEEWEKVLTATLMEGPAFVYFDNVEYVESGALAAALTASQWAGRILGKSQRVSVPITCSWVMTGNNPELSKDIARRVIDIRLDAEMERPEDRAPEEFAIPDLKRWVREERGKLVGACVAIIQAWIDAGMPRGSRSKASFEDWARVFGGILEHAGVDGFLGTPEERRAVDQQAEEIRGLIVMWLRARYGKEPNAPPLVDWRSDVKAQDLVDLVEATRLPFEFAHREPTRVLGRKLRGVRDRVFEIELGSGQNAKATLRCQSRNNAMRYWLDVDLPGAPKVDSDDCPF